MLSCLLPPEVVGSMATMCSSCSSCASSRMRMSHSKPRFDVLVLVEKPSLPPERNVMDSCEVSLLVAVTIALSRGTSAALSLGREPKMSRKRRSISRVVE